MPECNLKNENCGARCTGANFSSQWEQLHHLENKYYKEKIKIIETLDCESCHNDGLDLMKFDHDIVNLSLGKKVFDNNNFHKKFKQVECIRNTCLKDGRC